MPILSPVTDNCPSWISGRVRMVFVFSWPNLQLWVEVLVDNTLLPVVCCSQFAWQSQGSTVRIWLWGADWKFRYEGNCLASQGLQSNAEPLSWVTEFSVCTEQHYRFFFLQTLPSTIVFKLGYALPILSWNTQIGKVHFRSRCVLFGSHLWCPDVMHDVILHYQV